MTDARGNRTSLTYPGGRLVSYGYDNTDRLTTISPSWDSGSYLYQYAGQRLVTTTLPSGLQTLYGYDPAHRLAGLSHQQGSAAIAGYSYNLDLVQVST